MKEKIIEVGVSAVSKHGADPEVVTVVDVAPSSIPATKHKDFKNSFKKHTLVNKNRFFYPPGDPGFHIEIPRN